LTTGLGNLCIEARVCVERMTGDVVEMVATASKGARRKTAIVTQSFSARGRSVEKVVGLT
jgi:hypothetical protein